jgi:hypothetical protein
MEQGPKRYAVIVADGFGKSPSVNAAVAEAHDQGILSAASIMLLGRLLRRRLTLHGADSFLQRRNYKQR